MPKKTNFINNGVAYYRITATIGRNPDGSPIRKQILGSCKSDAEAKRDELIYNIQRGLGVGFDKLTFGDTFKEWFDNVHIPKLALSSATRYTTDYRLRIKPSCLSMMKLIDVKSLDIQKFYNGLLTAETSVTTIRNTHKLLSSFFSYCVKTDMIIKNPLHAVELPKERKVQPDKAVLNKSDIEKLVRDSRVNGDAFIFVFAVFTGLREGETLALTHKDIDLVNGFISINKSVNHLMINGKYQAALSTTKTTGSTRQIPLFDEIRPLLLTHIRNEKEKHIRLGVPFSEDSILFSSQSGGYIEARNLRRRWERLCKRISIERTTVHALRHTFCSMLAENGVNLKTASELMGHSDTNTTLKIYTHVQKEEKKRGIATLSSAFPVQ